MTGRCAKRREQEGSRIHIGELQATTVRVSPFWRSRNRSNELICSINVAGFASVMLVFLYVFMSPCAIPPMRGLSVDLARVAAPTYMGAADREDALLVAVQRDGRLYLRNEAVSIDALAAKIRQGISRGSEKKVYLKADARAKYADVKEVLDAVHAAGVDKIGILVDQRRPPSQSSQSLQ